MQTITSANTSQNQLPCTHKVIDFTKIGTLLDYGCGKYDTFKNLVESNGVTYFGYDKFNRTEAENIKALQCMPDLITCNNVLNVIDSLGVIDSIIEEVASYKKPAIFCVYEGNRTNEGKPTKNGTCYQRNEKSSVYTERLEKHFSSVVRKGNIFFCNI